MTNDTRNKSVNAILNRVHVSKVRVALSMAQHATHCLIHAVPGFKAAANKTQAGVLQSS